MRVGVWPGCLLRGALVVDPDGIHRHDTCLEPIEEIDDVLCAVWQRRKRGFRAEIGVLLAVRQLKDRLPACRGAADVAPFSRRRTCSRGPKTVFRLQTVSSASRYKLSSTRSDRTHGLTSASVHLPPSMKRSILCRTLGCAPKQMTVSPSSLAEKEARLEPAVFGLRKRDEAHPALAARLSTAGRLCAGG